MVAGGQRSDLIVPMAKYILTCSDTESPSGAWLSAANVAKGRIKAGLWPLYRRTSFLRSFQIGDECFIYLAGTKTSRQSVVGRFIVAGFDEPRFGEWFEEEALLSDSPAKVLVMDQIEVFPRPVPLRPLLPKLQLVNFKTEKWGSFLQGGAKRLSDPDAALILGEVS